MSSLDPAAVVVALALSAVLPGAAYAPKPEPPTADRPPEAPRGRPQATNAQAKEPAPGAAPPRAGPLEAVTLFLCGDVMTGRGIDQVLPRPCDPRIHEGYMTSAKGYVRLAERAHGRIPTPVDFAYIWGEALGVLRQVRPNVRIINLETSITRSNSYWRGKGIHYRMSPQNVRCIPAAGIDVCVLGNNHVLDWGYAGLAETLKTLAAARVKIAGAGKDLAAAQAPAVCQIAPDRRVLVFAFGCPSSGIPRTWAAGGGRAGVHFLPAIGDAAARRVAALVRKHRRGGDIVVASIHWGGNWGYPVPEQQRRFAHKLVEAGGVDLIHGHSSHHAKGIEVHRGKLILYGCGDLINDYEGISGREEFRSDLGLMYFASVAPSTGQVKALRMVPMQMRRFQLRRASPQDAKWLQKALDRECRRLRARVELAEDNALRLEWQQGSPGR